MEGAVAIFLDGLTVQWIRSSRMISVTFEASRPELAARVANTVSDLYIRESLAAALRDLRGGLAVAGRADRRPEEEGGGVRGGSPGRPREGRDRQHRRTAGPGGPEAQGAGLDPHRPEEPAPPEGGPVPADAGGGGPGRAARCAAQPAHRDAEDRPGQAGTGSGRPPSTLSRAAPGGRPHTATGRGPAPHDRGGIGPDRPRGGERLQGGGRAGAERGLRPGSGQGRGPGPAAAGGPVRLAQAGDGSGQGSPERPARAAQAGRRGPGPDLHEHPHRGPRGAPALPCAAAAVAGPAHRPPPGGGCRAWPWPSSAITWTTR